MINPAFFVDEDVARMSPLARLMFQGLWTLADKRGRLEDRPARIKVQTLPYDECDPEALLAEVAAGGFIVRYEVAGRKVIQIRSFSKHQRPHPKEPDTALPGPPEIAAEKHGKPEHAGSVCPESESVPSGPSGSSEHMAGEPVPGEPEQDHERRSEPVESPDGWPTIEVYGSAVVDLWHELRGSPFPQPGPADFLVLSDWHASGIPVRVVERGMKDCIQGLLKRRDRPTGKPLKYFDGAVREAYGQWRARTA